MNSEQVEKNLTEQECASLAAAMNRKYRIALNERSFSVDSKLEDPLIEVQVCLKNADASYVYPVMARMQYEQQEMSSREAAMFLVDYIDQYFEEYLLEEDEEIFYR